MRFETHELFPLISADSFVLLPWLHSQAHPLEIKYFCLPVNLFNVLMAKCITEVPFFLFTKGRVIVNVYIFSAFNFNFNRQIVVSCLQR